MTRFALFASGPIGLRLASICGALKYSPTALVLDSREPERHEAMLQAVAADRGLTSVITSSDIADGHGVEELGSLGIDLGILAWWPYIITRSVIGTARMGFLNVHPSRLPYNRGKDPNFWALVEEAPFGVTIHFVDEGVDTGPIAFQADIDVTWEDTGETLYARAVEAIVELFRASLPRVIAGDIPRIPQDDKLATTHRRQELDPASRIDLDRRYTGRELLNLLRARTFPPHPAAWFMSGTSRYEVRVEIHRVTETDALT